MEDFRFWEQIYPKNMNDKNFEKIIIEIETSMCKSTLLRNLSQFEEMQIMRPNLLKTHERQKISKNKNKNCNNHITLYSTVLRFWDQICLRSVHDKKFEKNKHQI